jgi:spermidine synthase
VEAFLTIPIRGDRLAMRVRVNEVVHRVETKFQTIEIVRTDAFGKVLLLDGHVQLASLDEAAYHEALVHIPMLSLEEPRRALVIGGGDGGVLRELMRHEALQSVDMVEIDQGVVDASRRFLPELSAGAFDDPRLRLRIEDAFVFIREVEEPYDLIVMDVTDVYEGEDGALSEQLFTAGFCEDCRNALRPGGMLVTQADNHIFCPYSKEGILASLRPSFTQTGAFQALVPSFGGFSAYVWGGDGVRPPNRFPAEKAENLGLRYLNETTWRLAFLELPFSLAG